MVPVNLNITGNPQTGPLPGAKLDSSDFVNAIHNTIKTSDSWAHDPNAWAKPIEYNAGIHGVNFERYYNHPQFKKLGISPFRDNETIYNQNSTWWDDFVRMGSSWGQLFTTGFKSPYDFGSENSATEFQRAMAVGMSTRGGMGQFMTNLALNSAFTVGIAAELLAENFAIAGLTYATRGLATPVAAERAMQRVASTANLVEDMPGMINSTEQLIRNASAPAQAMSFFSKAKSQFANKAANFINPLENSSSYFKNLYTGAHGFNELNNFAKTRKAFGAFYRDLRMINLVYSEAMLEGNMARNEKNQKLIDDFYKENKKMPNYEEAQQIYQTSQNIGFSTGLYNIPVIYFTNKLVFNDLFKGFKPPSLVGEQIINGSERQLSKTAGWRSGQDVYTTLQKNVGKSVKDFLLRSPYVPWSKKYILGNLSEGFQEWAQEVTADAAYLYHKSRYGDPSVAGSLSVASSIGSAMSNQFSEKGFEVFASGFLTGSIVQGLTGVGLSPMMAPGLYKKYMNSEEFNQMKAAKQQTEDVIVQAANDVLRDVIGGFDMTVENAVDNKVLSEKIDQAERDNNQKAYMDGKDEKLVTNLYNLAAMQKLDLVYNHVDELSQLDDNSLVEAFSEYNMDASQLREKIETFKTRVKSFDTRYKTYREKFSNPYNPKHFDRTVDKDAYEAEFANYRGWEAAVRDVIMANELYLKNSERIKSVFETFTTNNVIKNAEARDFFVLLDETALEREAEVLRGEISVLKEGSPEQKAEAQKKQKRLDALNDYQSGQANYQLTMRKLRKIMAQNESRSASVGVGGIFRDKTDGRTVEVLSVEDDGTVTMLTEDNLVVESVDKDDLEPVYEDRFSQEAVEESNNKLLEIFKNYVQVITDVTKSQAFDEQSFNDSFVALRDYFALQDESTRLFATVNMLNNPQMFIEYADRMSQREKYRKDNFESIIRNSYTNLSKSYVDNIFLNTLYDMKVALDPRDAEKVLLYGNFSDVIYYDAFTANPIAKDDERIGKIETAQKKYKEALKAIKEEKERKTKEPEQQPEIKEEEQAPDEVKLADMTTQALVEYINATNQIRSSRNEPLLSTDLNDPNTKDFIDNDSGAQQLIKTLEVEFSKKKPGKPKRKTVDWTPERVPKGLEELSALYKERWEESEDNRFYVNEKGEKAFRVTYLKQDYGESGRPEASERGKVLDYVYREAIDNASLKFLVDEKGVPTAEAVEMVTDLVNKYIERKGYVIKFEKETMPQIVKDVVVFKKWADSMGLKLYAGLPTMVGKLGKDLYGGTIDILAKNKDGKYFIIDLKTQDPKKSRRKEAGKGYRIPDMIQLNAYAELFKLNTGIEIEGLYVLSMDVKHKGPFDSPEYGTVSNLGLTFDSESPEKSMEYMLVPREKKDIYELDKTVGMKRLKEETGGEVPQVAAAKYDLVNRFGMKQEEADKMTSPQILAAYAEALKGSRKPTKVINPDYVGKIVYVTPGAGKSTLAVDDINIIDMDQLIIAEMKRRQPQFDRRDSETDQDFIYRYAATFKGDKDSVNKTVYLVAKQYAKAGKTVLTGTIALMPMVDVVITIPSSNERVVKRFGTPAKAERYSEEEGLQVDLYEKKVKNGMIIEANKNEEFEDILYEPVTPEAPPTVPAVTEKLKSITPKVNIINYRTMDQKSKDDAMAGVDEAQKRWVEEEIAEFYEAIHQVNNGLDTFSSKGVNKGKATMDDVIDETLGIFRTVQMFPNFSYLLTPYLEDIKTALNTFGRKEGYAIYKARKDKKGQAKDMTYENLFEVVDKIITSPAAPVFGIEVTSENYTPELLRANPDKLFLFGDNNTRTGKGGQAVIRDEPNAMGISTKLLPKNTPEAFMSDAELVSNKNIIDSDIQKAKQRAVKEGKTIVLPKGGFGTGLAALAAKAPQTFAYLNKRLQEEFGFSNTTGELAALSTAPAAPAAEPSDAETVAREKWYEKLNNVRTPKQLANFEKSLSAAISTPESMTKYLKKHNLQLEELMTALDKKRAEITGQTTIPVQPEVDKEVKAEARNIKDDASSMAEEQEILEKISNNKMSAEQAKDNFLNNICAKPKK